MLHHNKFQKENHVQMQSFQLYQTLDNTGRAYRVFWVVGFFCIRPMDVYFKTNNHIEKAIFSSTLILNMTNDAAVKPLSHLYSKQVYRL